MSGPGEASKQVDIVGHIVDANYLEWFNPFTGAHGKFYLPQFEAKTYDLFGDYVIDIPWNYLSITRQVVMMWCSAAICIFIFVICYRKRRMIPQGMQALFEPILLYLRDEVIRPVMGKDGDDFLPYLWTLFFFIFFCNFLGLVPMGGTATANVSVTGALAFCTFLTIHLSGLKRHGIFEYAKSICPEVPSFVLPVMIVVEVIGMFVKPFALMIRLAANMVAGHVVLLSFLGFIFVFQSWILAIGVVGASLAIYLLELMVAVIQAYIFTFLSTIFINMGINPEH